MLFGHNVFAGVALNALLKGITLMFKSKAFLKEIITFIQQGCIKLSKSNSNDIYLTSILFFQINAVLLIFLFIK